MIVIIGKTASGKDTIVNILCKKHGMKKIVTYTTRPMRNGEINGITYHFISDEEFKYKINEGFFAEWKSYFTEDGVWFYGSAKEDYSNLSDNSIIILTPSGYKDVCKALEASPKAIYLYANNPTIKRRLELRGDNPEEAKRRIEHDNEDFKGVDQLVDKIVYNNSNEKIEDIVEKILTIIDLWRIEK